jgi:hypothetical protein
MVVSHTWNIVSLEYTDADGFARAVNQINWVCVSDDGAGHTWYNDSPPKRLDAPDPNNFTPFDTLTEATVIAWLGVDFIAEQEAINSAAIQKLIDAEAAGVGVPW